MCRHKIKAICINLIEEDWKEIENIPWNCAIQTNKKQNAKKSILCKKR